MNHILIIVFNCIVKLLTCVYFNDFYMLTQLKLRYSINDDVNQMQENNKHKLLHQEFILIVCLMHYVINHMFLF